MKRAVLLALAGCGRLGFDPLGGDPAGGDDDVPGDGAVDDSSVTPGDADPTGDGSPGDAPLGDWSQPTPLSGVGAQGNDSDPWMSADRLTLYFESTRPGTHGGADLWVATRASTSGSFSVVNVGAPISSTSDEHSPFLADNGHTMYFTSNRLGGFDVFTSTSSGGVWSVPVKDNQLSSVDDDIDVALSFDGLSAIVTRIHNGVRRFYRSERPAKSSPWSTPLQLSDLATAQQAGGPALAGDGTLYFHAQFGALSLFTARPAGEGFEQPAEITELGSGLTDTQPHVDVTGRYLVFARQGRIVESTR